MAWRVPSLCTAVAHPHRWPWVVEILVVRFLCRHLIEQRAAAVAWLHRGGDLQLLKVVFEAPQRVIVTTVIGVRSGLDRLEQAAACRTDPTASGTRGRTEMNYVRKHYLAIAALTIFATGRPHEVRSSGFIPSLEPQLLSSGAIQSPAHRRKRSCVDPPNRERRALRPGGRELVSLIAVSRGAIDQHFGRWRVGSFRAVGINTMRKQKPAGK